MAQTHNNSNPSNDDPSAEDVAAFLHAAATVKYGVHDGAVWLRSRMSDDIGFIGTARVPRGFAGIHKDERPFVAMAVLEAEQNRAGGNSKAKTAADYQRALDASLVSKTEDSRTRDKDAIVDALIEHLTPAIRARVPNASDADIESTAKANIAKRLPGIVANGYKPLPKNTKTATGAAKVIPLDD